MPNRLRHRFPELARFATVSAGAIPSLVGATRSVCVVDEKEPTRDRQGHRIVQLRLTGNRDLAAELVGRGLAMVQRGPCDRKDRYHRLEDQAREKGLGHWGPVGQDIAMAILAKAEIFSALAGPGVSSGGG